VYRQGMQGAVEALKFQTRSWSFGLSVLATGGLLAGLFLPYLSSPEGDALCQTTGCPVTGTLAGGSVAGIAVILVAAFVVASVGCVVSARPVWALLGSVAAGGALALGLVSAFTNPAAVLPYATAAPVTVALGFWVFMAGSVVGLFSTLGKLGVAPRRRLRRPVLP
jgi:hypothetical protein